MSNLPSELKPLRGGIYQERAERKRKRRALAAATHRHFTKNPPMLDLKPLPEPKTRRLGIGEQLHVRRRMWLRALMALVAHKLTRRPKAAA